MPSLSSSSRSLRQKARDRGNSSSSKGRARLSKPTSGSKLSSSSRGSLGLSSKRRVALETPTLASLPYSVDGGVDSDSDSSSSLDLTSRHSESRTYEQSETDSDAFSALPMPPTSSQSLHVLSKSLRTSHLTNNQLSQSLAHVQKELRATQDRLGNIPVLESVVKERESKIDKLTLKLKESNYAVNKLRQELDKSKTMLSNERTKTKSAVNGLRSSLLTVESAIKSRSASTRSHVKTLTALQQSFARHLKAGYSSGPSHTAFDMLDKMGQALANLTGALDNCDDGVADAASRAASDVASATLAAAKQENGSVANAMTDICSELEAQNARLRREVERLSSELKAARSEEDARARLLPEYRLEIVRSRGMAEVARKELEGEKEAVTMLRRRLDEMVVALRHSEDARVQAEEKLRRVETGTRDWKGLGEEMAGVLPNEYLPTMPTMRQSTSPLRGAPKSTAVSADEELFARLLAASNDKLLADLTKSVEERLEDAVKRQADVFRASTESLESVRSQPSPHGHQD